MNGNWCKDGTRARNGTDFPRRSARHHVLLLIILLAASDLLLVLPLCAFTLSIHHRWHPRDRPYDTELRGSVHVFKTALLLVKEGISTTVTLGSNQVAFSLSFPIFTC